MGLIAKAEELGRRPSDMADEVAIVRAVLAHAVEHWNEALEMRGEKAVFAQAACEQLIRNCVKSVTEAIVASAKVRATDEGAVAISSVAWVMGEVTRAINEVVIEVNPELAEALVARIGKIKMPVDGTLEKFMRVASDEAFL